MATPKRSKRSLGNDNDAEIHVSENAEQYATALTARDQRIAQLESELAELRQQLTPQDADRQAEQGGSGNGAAENVQQQIQELNDKYLRARADLENYRKRAAQLIADSSKDGRKAVIETILPAVDNLERAVVYQEQHKSDNVQDLLTGVRMTLWQMREALAREGLKPIEAEGQPFDPRYHEAVEVQDVDDEVEEGTVVGEIQKGYVFGDTVLRAAKVRVAHRRAGGQKS